MNVHGEISNMKRNIKLHQDGKELIILNGSACYATLKLQTIVPPCHFHRLSTSARLDDDTIPFVGNKVKHR